MRKGAAFLASLVLALGLGGVAAPAMTGDTAGEAVWRLVHAEDDGDDTGKVTPPPDKGESGGMTCCWAG